MTHDCLRKRDESSSTWSDRKKVKQQYMAQYRNIKGSCYDEDGLGRTRLRVMETQDVNEAGGLAFLATSKTSKDFSLVTSGF